MSQSLCAVTVFTLETWENRSGLGYQPRPNPPLALTERQAAMQATQNCSVDGCERVVGRRGAHGMCHACYEYRRRRGEFPQRPPILPPAERLAAGVVRMPNGCLEWTGHKANGYGSLSANGKAIRTHRLAWELVNGPIPDGLSVCHRCDNPPCCEPTHLFLGTQADNNADRDAKSRGYQTGRAREYHRHGVTQEHDTNPTETRP